MLDESIIKKHKLSTLERGEFEGLGKMDGRGSDVNSISIKTLKCNKIIKLQKKERGSNKIKTVQCFQCIW